MPGCAVAKCANYTRKTKGTEIKYFKFPANDDLCKQWIVACRREDKINLKHACICSIHFKATCFEVPLRQQMLNYTPRSSRNLKPDAIPTLHLPRQTHFDEKRLQRLVKRRQKLEVNELLESSSQAIPIIPSTSTYSGNEEIMNLMEVGIAASCTGSSNEDTNKSNTDTELQLLRQQLEALHKESAELKQQMQQIEQTTAQKYENALAKIFTPGQIKKLVHSEGRNIHWSPNDIAAAISLRSISPKAYRYLRSHNYPLPALSTLRKWVANFNVDQGIMHNVLKLMKQKCTELSEFDRLCVIAFDEVYLSNKVEIDKKNEQVIGPHKCCQTAIVRGLISNWKQPIYYKFDQAITKEILEKIIRELYLIGYIVVSIVCDMGSGNMKLWSDLNIGHDKNCWFVHPADDQLRIFVFADAPHLIKLCRNHFIDAGFVINNHIINKEYLECLLNISTSELTLAHKLTPQHLDLKGPMRQRVKPAVQVFSNSVAKAIAYCGQKGLMPKDSKWKEASDIIKVINDWFDLLNSRQKFTNPGQNAFGTDLEIQMNLLNKMSQLISDIKIGAHKGLIQFQKGILISNKSLAELFAYVQEKYNVEYILTSRLNQDVVENFFACMRGMGGSNDHPTALDFKHRLRWFILGKHSTAIFVENKNTTEGYETSLINVLEESCAHQDQTEATNNTCLIQPMLQDLSKDTEESSLTTEEEPLLSDILFVPAEYLEEEIDSEILDLVSNFEVKEKINQEAIKYIAGYVAYRFRNKYTLGIPTNKLDTAKAPEWLTVVSQGSLLYPNNDLFQAALILENEFFAMHGSSLSKETKIFHKLADRTVAKLKDSTLIPYEVLLCLSRTRTYIRLRDFNRKISFDNCQRKVGKKLSKFTNVKK